MAKPERVEYAKWFNLFAPAPKTKTIKCAWCKKYVQWNKGTKLPAGFRCDDCTPESDY